MQKKDNQLLYESELGRLVNFYANELNNINISRQTNRPVAKVLLDAAHRMQMHAEEIGRRVDTGRWRERRD